MKAFCKNKLSVPELNLILFALVAQLLIGLIPDPFPGVKILTDIDVYRSWVRELTLHGLEAGYWMSVGPAIDYPPLIPYLYWVLGVIVRFVSPAAFFSDGSLDFFIKLPSIICNVLLSYTLLVECKSRNLTLTPLGLFVMFINIPFIFGVSYSGQTDSIMCLFVLKSFLFLEKNKLTVSYVFFTLACLTKPIVWPFSVLIAFYSVLNFPIRKIAGSFLPSIGVLVVFLAPFILIGRLPDLIQEMFYGQLNIMPYITVNAHNFWWIVTASGAAWVRSSALIFMGVDYKTLGIFIYFIICAFVFFKAKKYFNNNAFDLLGTASVLGLTFFIVGPHMHENHMIIFFPLAFIPIMVCNAYGGSLLYLCLMFSAVFNLVLHDPYLIEPVKELLNSGNIHLYVFATKANAVLACLMYIQIVWEYLKRKKLSAELSWLTESALVCMSRVFFIRYRGRNDKR